MQRINQVWFAENPIDELQKQLNFIESEESIFTTRAEVIELKQRLALRKDN